MIDRHDRQILTGHGGDQTAPESRANHYSRRLDVAATGFHAADAAVFDVEAGGGGVRKRLELAGLLSLLDQVADNRL